MLGRTNAGGGGSGGTLTVTGVAGDTVTVSKDGKTYSRTFNSSGIATFKGLKSGKWTVTMTGSSGTATRTVEISADYELTMAYFSATINVTYPSGSAVTVTDGTTTLPAPDTSGIWTCIVPNAGTWTVTATDGTKSKDVEVSITTEGQVETVTISYSLQLLLGTDQCTTVTGGWVGAATGYLYGESWGKITATYSENGAVLKANSGSSSYLCSSLVTTNKIDVTDYSSLNFSVAGTSTSFRIAIVSAYTLSKSCKSDAPAIALLSAGSLDISAYSGEYYVMICCSNGSGSTATVTVNNIYLE